MSQKTPSYRNSHTAPDKGPYYDCGYAADPELRLYWSLERQFLGEFLETRFSEREIHLLDFACGTGRITQFLEERVTTSTGVDVSSAMLDVARQKLRRTELIQADLTTRNVLSGRRFNLITAFRFFVNAERPLRQSVIKALAAMLDDDGYLIFNNHQNRTSPWYLLGYIRNRWRDRGGPYSVMSAQEMRNLAAGAGLRVTELQHMGLLFPPLVRRMPEALAETIERTAMRLPFLASVSQELIAVCRHKGVT